MKPLLALLLMSLLWASPCQAYTGKALTADCQAARPLLDSDAISPSDLSLEATRCLAYLTGLADGYQVGDYLAGTVGVQLQAFCPPTDPQERAYRLLRAALAHLDLQPPSPTAARILAASAFSKAFPCPHAAPH